jgi:hypothetical protein
MKLYNILYVTVSVLLIGTSCKDSNKKESATESKIDSAPQALAPKAPSATKGIIKFKVNGQQVSTSAWNVSIGSSMTGICILNVTSNMHEDTRSIGINVNGCATGHYQFFHGHGSATTKGIAYGTYRPDYLKKMMEAFHFESGTFNIESFNEKDLLLNASFSGKVKNDKGEGLEITDGQVINALVKTPPKGLLN